MEHKNTGGDPSNQFVRIKMIKWSFYEHDDQILIFEMLKLSLSEWSYCYEPDDQLELEDVTWTLSKLNLSGSKRSGSGKVFGSLWDILSTKCQNVIVVEKAGNENISAW